LNSAPSTNGTLPSWNLSAYYSGADDPRTLADLDQSVKEAEAFAARWKGKVEHIASNDLAAALAELDSLTHRLWRVAIYSSLIHAADSRPAAHGRLKSLVQERASQVERLTLFFDLEINKVSDDRLPELLAHPGVAPLAHFVRRKRTLKPHLLSEAEEQVLTQASLTGRQAWVRMFHEIVDYTRFAVEGETEPLSFSAVAARLQNANREVRRRAADAITAGLKPHERTLTYLFNIILLDRKVEDELRHFAGPAHARHLSNETDQASVDAMLEACERYHDTVERYYKLKGRLLGIEKLEDYDRYAPMDPVERTYPYDEARAMVMEAFEAFSPRFAGAARRFFENQWIDVPPREGKQNGAFCSGGMPGSAEHSVVLLNYTGKAGDVKTLAHELGHGVHFELSRERVPLLVLEPTLCLAETASVFAERIVFDRLVRQTPDRKQKLALLCTEIEASFATVFRQVGFTRFEMLAHTARRSEGELSFERLAELWMQSSQPMFGSALNLRPDYRYWWIYIPHFVHTPFYCYAYAFGKLLTLALYELYQERGEPFVGQLMDLLSRGGSASPEELLQPLGVDTRDPAFWSRGLDSLDAMVREAEELAAQA